MNRYLIKLLIIIPCVFLSGKEISVHPEPGKGIYEKPFFPMDEYKENKRKKIKIKKIQKKIQKKILKRNNSTKSSILNKLKFYKDF